MIREIQVFLLTASLSSYIILSTFIPLCIHKTIAHYFSQYLLFVCNVKVYVHGNKNLLKNNNIYMANHYEGIDFIVLYSIITQPLSSPCYAIGKDDVMGKQYPVYSIASIKDIVIKLVYNNSYIIPYTRGDKESGKRAKKRSIEIIKNNKLLVFPEGRSWRKGLSHDFKPGMFEVAQNHNICIVPITLKYRDFDGKNKGEKCVLQDWMNITGDVFIHDEVQHKDYKLMLKETFEKITSKN